MGSDGEQNKTYKQLFIVRSSTCCTKPLSKLLTTIISKIKDGLKRYTDTIYYRNGVKSNVDFAKKF